jgi:hypothetical protein
MSLNPVVEEYLRWAIDAEEHAAKIGDDFLRDSWLAIARSYREMAQRRLDVCDTVEKGTPDSEAD